MKADRFQLGDDGTLDTVIIDTETGEEHRFNYQNSEYDGSYDDFVAWCIETLESEVLIQAGRLRSSHNHSRRLN